jgi:hypothetical protein
MVDDPQKELETILYQSRQLVGRMGANESQNEITRMRLMGLRDAAIDTYASINHPSEQLTKIYKRTVDLYKSVNIL